MLACSRGQDREEEDDPRTTPTTEWIYALRTAISTTRTFQRFDIWLTGVTMLGKKRTRIYRQKRTAEYKMELHRHDNEPIKIWLSLQSHELLRLPRYTYSALPNKNIIRLMNLYPGAPNDVIECDISAHSLDDLPPYETLSYAWGNGTSRLIVCDGQSISIHENLEAALRRLRYSTSARLLWIDAVCINQTDVPERNSQVQQMRLIYQMAQNVVVWLGESSKTSSIGFSLLRDLVLAANSETYSMGQIPLKSRELSKIGLPDPSSPRWRALSAIFWRQWFTRVWVIQEISVSQFAVVVCGADTCSWSDMARAAKYISNHSLEAVTDVDPRLVLKLFNFCTRSKSKPPLLDLLSEARSSYATDDKDKVYAILGLASDVGSLSLCPDYSKNVSELYIGMVRSWIERDRNLDILSAVEDHRYRIRPGLPSWVPDWEVHVPSSPFSAHPDFTYMRAASDSKAICTFANDGKTMKAYGQIIDSLQYVGITFEEYIPASGTLEKGDFISDALSRNRTQQWERMAEKLNTYPSGETTKSAFIQTLIGQVKSDSQKSPDELHLCYHAWRRYWELAHRQHGKFIQLTHVDLSTEDLARATYFMKAQQRAAYGRRFFTTKNGYMGLGASLAHIDDIIVILLGGKTPFILRNIGKKGYRFVGECYVHGIMKGEGLRKNASMQVFPIW